MLVLLLALAKTIK